MGDDTAHKTQCYYLYIDADAALEAFEASEMGKRYPTIGQIWRGTWARVIPFFRCSRDQSSDLYD